MTGTFAIPNIVFEDKYFIEDEERPLTRREALAWLAKHVRWTDNCTLRRGQGVWSERYLAEAWNWARTKVQRFLKRLESMNLIRLESGPGRGPVEKVITYLFSMVYKTDETVGGLAPGQDRASTGPKTKSGKSGKKDSPIPPEGAAFDGSFAGEGGAGPSDIPPQPEAVEPTSKAKRAKREKVDQPILPPDDWQPSEKTVLRLMEARGISRLQVRLQAERFINSVIASNNKYGYVNFGHAFANWVLGKYYEDIPESQKSEKSFARERAETLEDLFQ